MSFASRHTKVKPKGVVREVKIVHSISRRGVDTLIAEEVKTPRHEAPKASSSSRLNESSTPNRLKQSASPTKRPKLCMFDVEPIPCQFEGPDDYKKRQTLVLFSHDNTSLNV